MTAFTLDLTIDDKTLSTSADVATVLRSLADTFDASAVPMVSVTELSPSASAALGDRFVRDAKGEIIGSWKVEEPENYVASKNWLEQDFIERMNDRVREGECSYSEEQIALIVENLGSTDALSDCTDSDWFAVDMILDDAIAYTFRPTAESEPA